MERNVKDKENELRLVYGKEFQLVIAPVPSQAPRNCPQSPGQALSLRSHSCFPFFQQTKKRPKINEH
jgi:hypothetical protein